MDVFEFLSLVSRERLAVVHFEISLALGLCEVYAFGDNGGCTSRLARQFLFLKGSRHCSNKG